MHIEDGTSKEDEERDRRRSKGCGGVPIMSGVVYVSSSQSYSYQHPPQTGQPEKINELTHNGRAEFNDSGAIG